MAGNSRRDPYAGFNFIVTIDGNEVAAFSECSGLASETAVIEYREGSERGNRVRKLPGLTKYSNVTLKRGITGDKTLWNWRKSISEGSPDRRTVTIALLDATGVPVLRWHLMEAWPCKWVGPDLKATGNEIAIETLEIAHEGLELE